MSWPAVAVRTMPGRSMIVRSGTCGARTSTTMLSDENVPDSRVKWVVHTSMASVNAEGDVTSLATFMSPASSWPVWRSTLTDPRHRSSLLRFIVSWHGHRVTSPVPRGKGTPLSASSTDDLPQDWSPMTAICGSGTSFSTPRRRISSTRSSIGLTSFWFWRDKALASMLDIILSLGVLGAVQGALRVAWWTAALLAAGRALGATLSRSS